MCAKHSMYIISLVIIVIIPALQVRKTDDPQVI